MADGNSEQRRRAFWIWLIAIVILLITLYFYAPFEKYLLDSIPNVHFSNVIFWFASLVGVVAYVIAHWSTFKARIFRPVSELDAEGLVFDSLQVAILVAVIFCAGATLQAVQMLGEHLVNRGPILDSSFGEKLLSIILLVILAVLFFLLHFAVRAFRGQRTQRRTPMRRAAG